MGAYGGEWGGLKREGRVKLVMRERHLIDPSPPGRGGGEKAFSLINQRRPGEEELSEEAQFAHFYCSHVPAP